MDDQRKVTTDILRFWFCRIIKKNTAVYYIVFQQDEPVGFTGLNRIDWENGICQEEHFLNRRYIGTRLGLRLFLCRELVLKKLRLKVLVNYINPKNDRSIAIAKRMAYEFVGIKNGFYVYRSECATRRNMMKSVARTLGMEKEFIRYFGKDIEQQGLQDLPVRSAMVAEAKPTEIPENPGGS